MAKKSINKKDNPQWRKCFGKHAMHCTDGIFDALSQSAKESIRKRDKA